MAYLPLGRIHPARCCCSWTDGPPAIRHAADDGSRRCGLDAGVKAQRTMELEPCKGRNNNRISKGIPERNQVSCAAASRAPRSIHPRRSFAPQTICAAVACSSALPQRRPPAAACLLRPPSPALASAPGTRRSRSPAQRGSQDRSAPRCCPSAGSVGSLGRAFALRLRHSSHFSDGSARHSAVAN